MGEEDRVHTCTRVKKESKKTDKPVPVSQCYQNVAQTCEMCMHPPPRGVGTLDSGPESGGRT